MNETTNEKRLKYFKKKKSMRVLNTYETKDFLEVICREGGDTLTFRVYGEDKFVIYER